MDVAILVVFDVLDIHRGGIRRLQLSSWFWQATSSLVHRPKGFQIEALSQRGVFLMSSDSEQLNSSTARAASRRLLIPSR